MAWARDAKRLADDGHMVIVFLDELTTVPPTTQAAMLRLLTENVCGELQLPDYEPGKGGVVYLCASNAVEWAAGGQEIQAPMANRLWHGEFPMDHETWCDMMVSDFPGAERPAASCRPIIFAQHHHTQRALIAAYVRAAGRDSWLAPPRRSRTAQRGLAIRAHVVSRLTVAGGHRMPCRRAIVCFRPPRLPDLVGDQALPFLEYRETLNLPILKTSSKIRGAWCFPIASIARMPICYSLVGAVLNNKTPERWQAAMIALGVASRKNADIPDRGCAHAVRQAPSSRRSHQVARGMPAVLRADAARQAHAERVNAHAEAALPS